MIQNHIAGKNVSVFLTKIPCYMLWRFGLWRRLLLCLPQHDMLQDRFDDLGLVYEIIFIAPLHFGQVSGSTYIRKNSVSIYAEIK